MAEYWEPIHDRGIATNAVWQLCNVDFQVGTHTFTDHQTDVTALPVKAQERDDAEDLYDMAVDAKDANLAFIARINVRAAGLIRGNLVEENPLSLELDDVTGMPNLGSGKILARARKLTALWVRVNAERVAAVPALEVLIIGDSVTVAAVQTAVTGHEVLLQDVASKLGGWSLKRTALRTLAAKVDKNNKRWYEAWASFYAEGTAEHDALSQIDTGSAVVELPGAVTFTLMADAANGEIHIDATADHATHFRELRQAPGETEFIERASNAVSPLHDPASLPGAYNLKMQARNSAGDGPVSAVQTVTVT